MAFTSDELYHLEYRLSSANRNMKYHDEYSEPWTKARLAKEEIIAVKANNHTLPQVGDLITEGNCSTDPKAIAVVLEVRDRRKNKDVYRVLAGTGSPLWLDKDYIEYQCILLS